MLPWQIWFDYGTGQCYDFSGREPSQKGNNQYSIAKGTTELVVQSTLRAVAVDSFSVEPAHRVHSVKEVLQHACFNVLMLKHLFHNMHTVCRFHIENVHCNSPKCRLHHQFCCPLGDRTQCACSGFCISTALHLTKAADFRSGGFTSQSHLGHHAL